MLGNTAPVMVLLHLRKIYMLFPSSSSTVLIPWWGRVPLAEKRLNKAKKNLIKVMENEQKIG